MPISAEALVDEEEEIELEDCSTFDFDTDEEDEQEEWMRKMCRPMLPYAWINESIWID